jgi:hypothetical protein
MAVKFDGVEAGRKTHTRGPVWNRIGPVFMFARGSKFPPMGEAESGEP